MILGVFYPRLVHSDLNSVNGVYAWQSAPFLIHFILNQLLGEITPGRLESYSVIYIYVTLKEPRVTYLGRTRLPFFSRAEPDFQNGFGQFLR